MEKVLISRTDGIGDVLLTLPLCKQLSEDENMQITLLCRDYTQPLKSFTPYIQNYLSTDFLFAQEKEVVKNTLAKFDAIYHIFPNKQVAKWAKSAGIKKRVGTSHRLFHWLTCSKKIGFTRKNSNLHEAQLNFKLLGGDVPKIDEISKEPLLYTKDQTLSKWGKLISPDRLNIIIHPKSKGSAVEWSTDNYLNLIEHIGNQVNFLISGTADEAKLISKELLNHTYVTNVTGKFALDDFVSFVGKSDGLIAASTGPLHIAAALGKHCLGLYQNVRPIFAKRWHPIGPKADWLEEDDINKIEVFAVAKKIMQWTKS